MGRIAERGRMVQVPVTAAGRSIPSARGEGELCSPGVWPALRVDERCLCSDELTRSFDSLRSLRMTRDSGIQVVPRFLIALRRKSQGVFALMGDQQCLP